MKITKSSFVKLFSKVSFIAAFFASAQTAEAQISLSGPYSQNFDVLPTSTSSSSFTNNATISGWYAMQNGVAATSIVGGSGTTTTAGLRSFGTGSDRALGGVRSTGDFYYGVHLKNTTGSTINSFTIQYTVEQYRKPSGNKTTTLNFHYNKTAASITNLASPDFQALTEGDGAYSTGGGGAGTTYKSVTYTFAANITLDPNEEIMLRWTESNTDGVYLSLDDIQIIPNSTTTAPASIYYSKSTGDLNVRGTWGTNADGTGTQPPSTNTFANASFLIANRASATLTSAWSLGSNAKVVVNAGEFVIPSTSAFSGTVDVADNATLTINNATLPTLGTLGESSTVVYNNATAIPAKTYGNLTVAGANRTLSSGTVTVNGAFTVNAGNSFTQSGGKLVVKGNMTTAGSVTFSGGEVEFNANSGTQLIPAHTFNDLTVSGGGTKQLQGNTIVNGVLNVAGGVLTTVNPQTTTLTLGANGSVTNENADHYFQGNLVKAVTISGTGSTTFGDMGVTFNNTGSGNWGVVTVTRTTGVAAINPNDNSKQGVKRTYHISPATQAGTNVNMTFQWLTSEDNGLNFSGGQAQAWKSTDGGATWNPVGSVVTINTNGDVRTANLTTSSFSIWTFSDPITPLPVSWLSFNGKQTNNGILLNWATASEKNTATFEVERSLNGKNFETIGTVKAAGNSNQVLNYNFTDKQPLHAAVSYYRLKQTDLDGAFEYSAMVAVSGKERAQNQISVSPNPFSNNLKLQLSNGQQVKHVMLTTLEGKEVYKQEMHAGNGTEISNLPALKPGMYLLHVTSAEGTSVMRVVRR